jgi:hypothetical protein
MESNNMTDKTTTAPTTDAPVQTGLTVQDLTLTLQVIQVAASRGAFKADELTSVGGLYDRIFKFLESTGAITTQPAATTEAPATPNNKETV